ncbi:MAG TPA: methyltransferase domain-containing protein [Vicinamibacterales bacterium]|nr:methyltransferase domain-containing protein [Vicinamibacterales bacterium]
MAHYQQLQFVGIVAQHLTSDWAGLRVLEVGSLAVNGSVRPLFPGSDYTGIDLVAGDGVDLVASGDAPLFPDETFDLTLSCECFEHNPKWADTFRNMHRMTRRGGVVLITCAARGRQEHGTVRTTPHESPGTTALGWHYYRNLNRDDFARHFDLAALFDGHVFFRNDVSKDLYFVGRRAGGTHQRLRLDFGGLNAELISRNTIVKRQEPFRVRRIFGRLLELPLHCAERLPDRLFQSFALRWGPFATRLRNRSRRT